MYPCNQYLKIISEIVTFLLLLLSLPAIVTKAGMYFIHINSGKPHIKCMIVTHIQPSGYHIGQHAWRLIEMGLSEKEKGKGIILSLTGVSTLSVMGQLVHI